MTGEVIVSGWIDFAPADRDQALRHFADCVSSSRQEAGCLEYAFSPDHDLPARVRVFERWASDAALTEHLQQPHVGRLREALAPLSRTDRSMTHSTVAVSRPMGSTTTAAAPA